ncbi:hypothetical protein SeLEV6574_g07713 [Synchytrium endobioticum]|nr:hypothetical protein SeLEV6574_g07713 [Synchytrium endobioticum]
MRSMRSNTKETLSTAQHQVVDDEIVLLEGPYSADDENFEYYESFQLKKGRKTYNFRVGDVVSISQVGDQTAKAYGRMLAIYKDQLGDHVTIEWMCRPHEIWRIRSKRPSNVNLDLEIFATTKQDDVELNAISSVCSVTTPKAFERKYPEPDHVPKSEHGKVFFCRSLCNQKNGKIAKEINWVTYQKQGLYLNANKKDLDKNGGNRRRNGPVRSEIEDSRDERFPIQHTDAHNKRDKKRKCDEDLPSDRKSKKVKLAAKVKTNSKKSQMALGDEDNDFQSASETDDSDADGTFECADETSDSGPETESEDDYDDQNRTPYKRESKVSDTPKSGRRTPKKSTLSRTPFKVRTPKTPSRTPSKMRRGTSEVLTPTSSWRTFGTDTPLPARTTAPDEPLTDLQRAQQMLHVGYVPETLVGRENEYAEIFSFLESAIEDGSGGCMYIAGIPGTGKTATVREVMRSLEARLDNDEIAPFQFVELNGMKLIDPQYAYVRLWEALSGIRVPAAQALSLLDKKFSTPSPNQQPVVVLLDELDQLMNKKQTVIYNFADWPNRPYAHLILVAIANTMDLPDRLTNRIASRLGSNRLYFKPYTKQQLLNIAIDRLKDVPCSSHDAILYAAQWTQGVSGDARRMLDICRRAFELAELESRDKDGAVKLSIKLVQEAIKQMSGAVTIQAIARSSVHARMFLKALIKRMRLSGRPEATYKEIVEEQTRMCQLNKSLTIPNSSQFVSICNQLREASVILVESKLNTPLDQFQLVRLGSFTESDIAMGIERAKGPIHV